MTNSFTYAGQLKKRYRCYGHFYAWEQSGFELPSRSVLEIVDRTQLDVAPESLSSRPADAVVIMMNPGSSRPLEGGPIPQLSSPLAIDEKSLVLTQPDNTQYQLMRIGLLQQWAHIRVLNLSDLREPKSVQFIKKINALENVRGGGLHSIFAPERSQECEQALARKRDPLLLGWGQHLDLVPLAAQCMARLEGARTLGVPSALHPLLNAHPSPMMQQQKEQWLASMIEALERDG